MQQKALQDPTNHVLIQALCIEGGELVSRLEDFQKLCRGSSTDILPFFGRKMFKLHFLAWETKLSARGG